MNMKHQKQLFTVLLMSAACMLQAQRSETLLEKNGNSVKEIFRKLCRLTTMILNGNRSLSRMTGPSSDLST